MTPARDPLAEYRARRPAGESLSAGASSEPPGRPGSPPSPSRESEPGGVYVVQLHAARRAHYDLRLEWGGVLRSWAVPKGPSLDPAEKRLAVQVEDHPIEYADFEGVIPAGRYGAGAMIVWDRGTWKPLGDAETGIEHGKLLFELKGHKLIGMWTLVRLKKANEWLLIRERQGIGERYPAALAPPPSESILSGLTVEELASGYDAAPEVRRRLRDLKAPRRTVRPTDVRFMLASAKERPFSRAGWIFEPKLDGYRILAARADGETTLVTRGGGDVTRIFPDLAAAVDRLPLERFILDGEVVVHDESGRPSFQALQQRAALRRAADIALAARRGPVTYYAFDLLAACEYDLRPLPLFERKRLLRELLAPVGPVRYVEHFEERGEELYTGARATGIEGVVGKAADSPYRGGRSASWVKVRADRTADFVVVGYTEPRGSRAGFGALHLGAYRNGELIYVGRVGSGLTGGDLTALRPALVRRSCRTPACIGPLPAGADHRWVVPELVCEVRYKEWTEDGLLRQPVFVRSRDEKPAAECAMPEDGLRALPPLAIPATDGAADPRSMHGPGEILPGKPDKVFWPAEGTTKGELFAYYRAIAPWLLPYLENRPLVLTRYPDGIEGKSFYQKNAPDHVPEWVRTEKILSAGSDRELAYIVCDDRATLLYLVDLGTIPLHVWASRAGSLETPDWCVLDLDPKGAPFENVVEVARSIYKICKKVALPVYVKTSGSTGLHVLIPLGGRLDYEMSRSLAEVLARIAIAERPGIATIERVIAARSGKVYIDTLQNRRGQLIVAPFSVRPLPGAPVSTPLRWREVKPGLDIRRFTITSVPRRMARMGEDPLRPLLTETPDLHAALERLQDWRMR